MDFERDETREKEKPTAEKLKLMAGNKGTDKPIKDLLLPGYGHFGGKAGLNLEKGKDPYSKD